MKEVKETIILEDNIEYGIIDKIVINNIPYVYLCEVSNPEIFCIRKLIGENLWGLDNNEEFDMALDKLTQKHKESN